jgi:glycerophosphoryl diester phosphodiesterase
MIIIGHRGAKGLAPENTLASFERAIQEGVEYIEFDLRLTKDKKLVISHDNSTRRISPETLRINKSTAKEITALPTRSGECLITFDQLLSHLDHPIKLDIELKSRGIATYFAPYIPLLLQKGYTYDDFFVSSFKSHELRALRTIDKKVHLALLQRITPVSFLLRKKGLDLWGVGFKYCFAWPWTIKVAKEHGLFTYAYTINSQKLAARLNKWGLDAICTNYPDRYRSAVMHGVKG